MADYTSKIKEICDSLASIDVTVNEDEIVQLCLGDLAQKIGSFQIVVYTKEKSPSFFNLQSMLLVEENHTGESTSTHAGNKMLYMEEDSLRVRG